MGENSKIEWTNHTFNPWTDCQDQPESLPIPDYIMRKLEAKAEAA